MIGNIISIISYRTTCMWRKNVTGNITAQLAKMHIAASSGCLFHLNRGTWKVSNHCYHHLNIFFFLQNLGFCIVWSILRSHFHTWIWEPKCCKNPRESSFCLCKSEFKEVILICLGVYDIVYELKKSFHSFY